MNKSTKGALAASAAAVLLLGGAGSLAYWSDAAGVDGGSVNSGFLTLDAGTCDAVWTHTNGPRVGTDVVNIVPGDVITKSCTFVIGAEGDNLAATPEVPETLTYTNSGNTAASLSLPVTASYAIDGVDFTDASVVTEDNDTDVLTATIEVAFPYGTAENVAGAINDNDTQNLIVTLDELAVTLTQADNA